MEGGSRRLASECVFVGLGVCVFVRTFFCLCCVCVLVKSPVCACFICVESAKLFCVHNIYNSYYVLFVNDPIHDRPLD